MRTAALTGRILVAVAILAAIVAQLDSSIAFAAQDGPGDTTNVVVNFLSYFTVDSNLLSVVVLLAGAVRLLRRRPESPTFTTVRLAVTTYMVITGVVYNVLLRGYLVQGAVVLWSNEILHVVGPLYLLLDWLFAPGRTSLRSRQALPALIFPLIWLVYTLIRGPFAADPFRPTDYWYPYPFLNPVTSAGGYGGVAAYSVGIAAAVILVAMGLAWTSRRRSPADGHRSSVDGRTSGSAGRA